MDKQICNIIKKIREKTPLVHAITNYVTINDCANILLAFGASPAMVEAYDESYDFAKISSAIYINLGSLTKEQETAILMASISAKNNNVPVVLDPVACGAIPRKLSVINKISELGKIDVIKGNIGEIKVLAGQASKVRGVDSVDEGEGIIEACKIVAGKYNCTVVATGKVDTISDGKRVAQIYNGTEMFTKVTGAGCMLGALCAGACGAEEDKFKAVCSAVAWMNISGELAFEGAKFPGSFKVKLIDYIYSLNKETFMQKLNMEII
ncbi:hydroxyethylthiazole kinase [Haloimpatiens sp. FM7330]|uniref:hydroxyethylthiazole kinase n=1 Tax=Haloimpatiens sp. FM7330 TaxID=3298610 RepID=UPI0036308C4F